MQKRSFIHGAALLFALGASLPAVADEAPDYPAGKAVRIIVATGVGSGSDLTARVVGAELSKSWNVPFVIENKTGASGVIGTDFVAKAPGDGYTLLGTYAQHYTNQLVLKTSYDAVRDFEPIARIANSALVISVASSSPYKTLQDVIDAARKKPGILTYGTSGNGTTSDMAASLFVSMTGIELSNIPYKAPGQVAMDAAAGQIDLSFNGMSSVLPLIQSGRLRPLAVTTAARSQSLPEVPTVAELGYPGYEASSPIWIFAPRGTPPGIVKKLSDAVVKAARTPAFAEVARNQGLEVDIQDSAQAKAAGPGELEKWRKLIETATARNK
ncbi:Bug family tripartite tricarboxylate transporter substrate binding protein [Achromobacter xylosoxidans]|uniref:Bug family tripartite tricarboxylate transporter substrate binding protein n=1 Tax=Alcaligenes xylosoxydans xylosoxydans TaxID=85698 RepID=UPI0006675F08|nr:tripartite tricarboxylate transporter substrate binding protein [Achromobacter xylosoxidans]